MYRVAVATALLVASICAAAGQTTLVGSGSGFYVSNGWIVTNAHVVDECTSVEIVGQGKSSSWKADPINDLAAIKIDGSAESVIPIRRSPARLGEDVAALGYPLATVLSSAIKITTGNVNSLLGIGDDSRFLQVSAPIQPGNSGGPLVDQDGMLLGVNTARLSGEVDPAAQNVNFAVRANVVETFLQSRSIPYQTVDSGGSEMSTADLAEKVAPAVVQILCKGVTPSVETAGAPSLPEPVAITPNVRDFKSFDGLDVIGFDYGTLRGVSHPDCLSACRNDPRCRAATYNKREQFCFLKDNAVITVRNNDANGSIASELLSSVYDMPFTVISGADQPGGDYRNLRQSSFLGCFVECGKDSRCRAFSYIRKKNSCWLKDRSGRTVKRAGVDLGIK